MQVIVYKQIMIFVMESLAGFLQLKISETARRTAGGSNIHDVLISS